MPDRFGGAEKSVSGSHNSVDGSVKSNSQRDVSAEEAQKMREDLLDEARKDPRGKPITSNSPPNRGLLILIFFVLFVCFGALYFDKIPLPDLLAEPIKNYTEHSERNAIAGQYDASWPTPKMPAPRVRPPEDIRALLKESGSYIEGNAAYACIYADNPCQRKAFSLSEQEYGILRTSAVHLLESELPQTAAHCLAIGALHFQPYAPGRNQMKSNAQWQKCIKLFPEDPSVVTIFQKSEKSLKEQ